MSSEDGQGPFTTPENHDFYARRKYTNVNPNDREIRLLRVHPTRLTANEIHQTFPQWAQADSDVARLLQTTAVGNNHENYICCELLGPKKLESIKKKYAALSYCAGSVTETKRILVDGYWFNAFANLEHALDGFIHTFDRKYASANLLWTDQVCIHQGDHREKSHQVGFMRDIYENAYITYVVLSTTVTPMECAESGIEAVKLMFALLNARAGVEGHCWVRHEKRQRGFSTFFKEFIYLKPTDPVCEFLPQLFHFLDLVVSAKWWTRAWVCGVRGLF